MPEKQRFNIIIYVSSKCDADFVRQLESYVAIERELNNIILVTVDMTAPKGNTKRAYPNTTDFVDRCYSREHTGLASIDSMNAHLKLAVEPEWQAFKSGFRLYVLKNRFGAPTVNRTKPWAWKFVDKVGVERWDKICEFIPLLSHITDQNGETFPTAFNVVEAMMIRIRRFQFGEYAVFSLRNIMDNAPDLDATITKLQDRLNFHNEINNKTN